MEDKLSIEIIEFYLLEDRKLNSVEISEKYNIGTNRAKRLSEYLNTECDDLLRKAIQYLIQDDSAKNNIDFLKSKLNIGSNRANRISDFINKHDLLDSTYSLNLSLNKTDSIEEELINKEDLNEIIKFYTNEMYVEAIESYENEAKKANFKPTIELINAYLWSLYKNKGTEHKALENIELYLKLYPKNKDWNDLGGHICLWLGEKNNDLDLLKMASKYYTKSKNIDGISNCNKKVNDIKEHTAQKKIEQHIFKSSRGEMFCKFCAESEYHKDIPCEGRKNEHNYIFIKSNNGSWDLKCNKCGNSKYGNIQPCSI